MEFAHGWLNYGCLAYPTGLSIPGPILHSRFVSWIR
jgi:hypothetical protein